MPVSQNRLPSAFSNAREWVLTGFNPFELKACGFEPTAGHEANQEWCKIESFNRLKTLLLRIYGPWHQPGNLALDVSGVSCRASKLRILAVDQIVATLDP